MIAPAIIAAIAANIFKVGAMEAKRTYYTRLLREAAVLPLAETRRPHARPDN